MRILHVLNHTRRANGHVELAVDLACEQAAMGWPTAVVSGPGDFSDCLQDNGVDLFQTTGEGGAKGAVGLASALARASRGHRPQIVHAHMVKAAVIARLVRPVLRYGLVTTVHNPFDRQAFLMTLADRVIALSEDSREALVRRGGGSRIRIVRNGTIGGRRRPPFPVRRMDLHRPSVATVAGLHPRKGVADLIDAFSQIDIREDCAGPFLYVVGEGPDRAALEERAASSIAADRIMFLGYLADPREVLASTDIFVLASHAEGDPLVIYEARQMGCAIISTAVGGAPRALGDGARGLLTPPGDINALKAAMSRLLDDAPLRARLSAAAAEGLDDCSVARMTREAAVVYREAMGARGLV